MRRARSLGTFTQFDFLKRRAALDMVERLGDIDRHFPLGLEMGAHSPTFANALFKQSMFANRVGTLIGADSVDPMGDPRLRLDEEFLPIRPKSLDAIFSLLTLHWVNDLPGALIQIQRSLKPDGLFLGVMFGGATLTELRQSFLEAETELTGGASMRISPFADALDMSGLLQRAGFALPVSDVDRVVVRYDTPLHLMRDLRGMGEGAAPFQKSGRGLSRRVLYRMMEIYAERFSDPDRRIRATFELVSISGWAPSSCQPRAKQPGSATASLAEALGAKEVNAGEKANPRR